MTVRLIDTNEAVAVPFDTPIALVRSDERYEMTVFGTQVTYRRIPVRELARIEQHSQRRLNGTAPRSHQRDLELQYLLLDWQGLEDTHGQPVVCPIPVPERILHALPTLVRGAFVAPCQAAWPEGVPVVGDPAVLTVRRILSHEMEALRAEHTLRGLLDANGLSLAVVQHCLKAWDGVLDGGEPVPMDPDTIARLPLHAVEHAFQVITAAELEQAAALQNLDTPSHVTPPMAASPPVAAAGRATPGATSRPRAKA